MSEENQLTEELTAILEEIIEEPVEEQKTAKGTTFERVNETDILLSGRLYRVVVDYREAFDLEKAANRYSEVLSRYDFIVGDWGYDQLRLKGFFDTNNKRALPDQRIDTLEDYLYEYCNFGCAYFVLERVGRRKHKINTKKKKKKQTKNQAHVAEKKAPVKKTTKTKTTTKAQVRTKTTTSEKTNTKKFTIRKREE